MSSSENSYSGSRIRLLILAFHQSFLERTLKIETLSTLPRFHRVPSALTEFRPGAVNVPDFRPFQNGVFTAVQEGIAELLADSQPSPDVEGVLIRVADITHEIVGVALAQLRCAYQRLHLRERRVDLHLTAARVALIPGAVFQIGLRFWRAIVKKCAELFLFASSDRVIERLLIHERVYGGVRVFSTDRQPRRWKV